MASPTVRFNVNATGKNAGLYYAAAAKIMAESADREAQIMASQSAIAMNAVTGLTQSLTNGFMKAMEYSLAVKQADYDREMQLRNFQLQEEQMEMQRLQAQDLLLTQGIQREQLRMDIAQKKQDVDNAPWKRMATAQLGGTAAKIKSAILAARTETGDSAAKAEEASRLYATLPQIIEQYLMRGGDPSEASRLETEFATEIDKLNSLPTLAGAPVSRRVVQSAFVNPLSAAAERYVVETANNQEFQRDSVVRTQSDFIQGILNDPSILKAEPTRQAQYIEATGATGALRDKLDTILDKLESTYMNAPDSFEGYRKRVLKQIGSEEMQSSIRAAEEALPKNASAAAVMSLATGQSAGLAQQGVDLWAGKGDANVPVVNYPLELPAKRVGQYIAEGMSVGEIARVLRGSWKEALYEDPTLLTAGLVGPSVFGENKTLVGKALINPMMRPSAAVRRFVSSVDASGVTAAERQSAEQAFRAAAAEVKSGNPNRALLILEQWGEAAKSAKEYSQNILGVDSKRPLVPASLRPVFSSFRSYFGGLPDYAERFEAWRLGAAPEIKTLGTTPRESGGGASSASTPLTPVP